MSVARLRHLRHGRDFEQKEPVLEHSMLGAHPWGFGLGKDVQVAHNPELRQALVGTWLLESYIETDVETGAQAHPLGVSPQGLIMYTPDGYMSAQLQKMARTTFAGGDMYRGEPAEYAEAGQTYLAYSGRFFLDETLETLSHEVAVSFFPNWVGHTQIRLVELKGNRLHLTTDGPQRFNGKSKIAEIIWQRAEPNDWTKPLRP